MVNSGKGIEMKDNSDDYYTALLNRDPSYIGIFFVGVTTTSVFCISTCRARKPKRENVVFYKTYSEALKNGFRPCKICSPTENANETPIDIAKAIRLIKENDKIKISDQRLRTEDISPDKVRRWFNKTYGITFHAFQRMYRINNAYKELKDGKRTTDVAYNSGFESLSGFAYTFKKVMGSSPTAPKSKSIIFINRLTTPIGPMFICSSSKGICLLEFTDRKMLETEFQDLQRLLDAHIIVGENEIIRQAKSEIAAYFEGNLLQFKVHLDLPGSEFQQSVWKELLAIKYGQTSTYLKLAQSLNSPKASRAIGRANGANRVSIIVPCHRVISEKGSLTGYGGGIERKQWLIDHEKKVEQRIIQDEV